MYKVGQGMPSRIGTMIVGALIAFYTSYSFYRWHPIQAVDRTGVWSVDFVISILLLAGVLVFFYWLAFRTPKSADYLIDMDDELRKVVWPSVMPLFDPKTEAWGSTYVVIVCAVIFTVFIYVVDLVLGFVITQGLFQGWLFAG